MVNVNQQAKYVGQKSLSSSSDIHLTDYFTWAATLVGKTFKYTCVK